MLRGYPDTDIVISLARINAKSYSSSVKDTFDVRMKRSLVRVSDIRLATLLGNVDDGIGYINLSGFNGGSGKDFHDALLLLRASAPDDLKGLVLDLRGNPGGLLDQAVEVASYLVPENSEIVRAKNKNGEEIIYKSTQNPIVPKNMQLAVLVNKGSASASEIVAGAIQDLDAGIVVGPSTTYGKGLVQKIVPLPNNSALKYTIAKYYTPSGRCIQSVKYVGGRSNDLDSVGSSREDKNFEAKQNSHENGEKISEGGDSNGGIAYKDSERKLFYTKVKKRVVRDGGGIDPDIKTEAIKVGAAESILYSKGIYNEFAAEYLANHPELRNSIRNAAENEQLHRESAIEALGINLREGSSSTEKFPLTRTILGQYFVSPPPKLLCDTLSQTCSNKMLGINAKVPVNYFWGLNNPDAITDADASAIFNDFKKYVLKRVNDKDLTRKLDFEESTLVHTKLKDLEETILSLDLDENAEILKSLHSISGKVKQSILKDLDNNKKFVLDGVNLALLSRELPGRLIVYHTVIQDRQVNMAIDSLGKLL